MPEYKAHAYKHNAGKITTLLHTHVADVNACKALAAQVSGLLMALQPVPDLGIEGVPEGFTKSHMILLGFLICRAGQEKLGLQVVQRHLFEVQIDLGLLLSTLPQVDTDSKPLASTHSCLPKEKQAFGNIHGFGEGHLA